MSTAHSMDVDSSSPSDAPLQLSPAGNPNPSGHSLTGTPATQPAVASSLPNPLRQVSTRDLCEFKSSHQLVSVMLDAIQAHQRLHDDAGILHGDINPNTIVILDTPDGNSEGALIDYDLPISIPALRKIANPDRAVPPPPSRRYRPHYWPRF